MPWNPSYLCYLCGAKSDDIVHYDQTKHHVCRLCANKLFEIAQEGLEFKLQGQTILLCRKDQIAEPRWKFH